MTRVARLAWRIGLLLLGLYVVLAGLGLLITRADTRGNPLTEDDLSRWLAGRRTGFLDGATSVLVGLGAPAFVGVATVIGVVVLRLALGRWREPVFLVVTVAAQAALVALTAQVASRDAPDVTRLDAVSAGASYPSAHTAAATALLVAATLLVGWYVGPPGIRVPLLVVLIALPVLVGYAELYRGLHHLTDVLAGYLAGLGAVAVTTRTVLNHRLWAGQPDHRVRRRHDGHPARAAVIYNPIRVPDFPALRARIEAHMARAGWAEPLWLGTTVDDPGAGMCAAAVKEKSDLIIVCGGDGTVRVCAGALAGTDMPMALLPAGTGNLLARNLGIPLDEVGALRVALSGADRRIDVASIENHKFVVMAGLGFDAAIMRDASEGLKRAVGWPAYVLSGARHLRGRGIRVRVTLDDGEPFSRRVRTAVVGNVGKLLAGIPLLPDAEPDDGVLDLVLLAPAGIVGWARVAGRVLSRRGGVDRRVERFRAKHVLLETSQPQPRQLDGDLIEDGRTMDIRIEPAALSVRVPVTRRNR
jgi:diacylglycerol kinase family enzyme/membrane-associated phospholipid phosphatase